jgi:hypothetical protein
MELNKEKKMKSEQAVLPNPCLEEEEEEEEEFQHEWFVGMWGCLLSALQTLSFAFGIMLKAPSFVFSADLFCVFF